MASLTRDEDKVIDGASLNREHIAAILGRVHSEALISGPLLLCFLSGDADACCESMPRDPEPASGAWFAQDFPDLLRSALTLNPAVHDGAILLRRPGPSLPYVIDGWSYRLMAPRPNDLKGAMNRGSAYNSCLATSTRPGVDGVVLLTRGQVVMFGRGGEIDLFEV
jgi:hypothetical protein